MMSVCILGHLPDCSASLLETGELEMVQKLTIPIEVTILLFVQGMNDSA